MKQIHENNTHTLVVNSLVDRFKQSFEDTANLKLDSLNTLYAEGVHFQDPIHNIHGLGKLKEYFAKLCADVEVCQFEYLDEVVLDGKAYIKWDMTFSHPSLKKGKHRVRGVTQIHYDSRIYFQEDIYDMGSMIYEHVPLLGSFVTYLKRRLSK